MQIYTTLKDLLGLIHEIHGSPLLTATQKVEMIRSLRQSLPPFLSHPLNKLREEVEKVISTYGEDRTTGAGGGHLGPFDNGMVRGARTEAGASDGKSEGGVLTGRTRKARRRATD